MKKDEEKIIKYAKENKKALVKKFADPEKFPPDENPFAFFMAGSPCAGKTELSLAIIKIFEKQESGLKIVRIDPDEIKNYLPGYNGKNVKKYHRASLIITEKVLDQVLKRNQNFILDGTFSNYEKSKENIERAISKKRNIIIFYRYLDPLKAWDLTEKRARLDGRSIPKDFFINSLFEAKENVNKIKNKFGKKVTIYLVEGDFEKNTINFKMNIDNIDNYIKLKYNKNSLNKLLC